MHREKQRRVTNSRGEQAADAAGDLQATEAATEAAVPKARQMAFIAVAVTSSAAGSWMRQLYCRREFSVMGRRAR
ncbi:hypothetical protein L1887_06969 [Cichorium endivia]|nr:hypothetical protein L1887_06969 [Cichorium endivia]